jgi:hypothetical protein
MKLVATSQQWLGNCLEEAKMGPLAAGPSHCQASALVSLLAASGWLSFSSVFLV